MKKVYSKPEIVFESFSLSTNIAGSCSVPTNTPTQGSCAYVVTAGPMSWNIFLADMTGICTTTEAEMDKVEDGAYNGICYNVPYDENNLFNS